MVNGAHGKITPLVLKAVELGGKQDHVLATTLLHLEVEKYAVGHRQNQEIVTRKNVQVHISSFSFDHFQTTYVLSYNVQSSIIFNIIHSIEHEVDCKWGPWGEWKTCTKECGGGKKSRFRPIATPASNGGKPCEGNSTQWKYCNAQACDIDCEWGPWSAWSTCSKTCGWGVKSISREVAKPAISGGKPCEGPGVKREACNQQACPDVTKSGISFYFEVQ